MSSRNVFAGKSSAPTAGRTLGLLWILPSEERGDADAAALRHPGRAEREAAVSRIVGGRVDLDVQIGGW